MRFICLFSYFKLNADEEEKEVRVKSLLTDKSAFWMEKLK